MSRYALASVCLGTLALTSSNLLLFASLAQSSYGWAALDAVLIVINSGCIAVNVSSIWLAYRARRRRHALEREWAQFHAYVNGQVVMPDSGCYPAESRSRSGPPAASG